MIKAVLFDYGGVLSPGGKDIMHVYQQLLGVPLQEQRVKELHAQLRVGEITADEMFAALSSIHGKTVTPQQFVALSDIFAKNQQVYQLAQALRDHGITTGILSNIYQMSADKLSQEGYYDGFGPQILSCTERLAKPDPAIYQIAIERLGVAPNEILFIDDQAKCLPPARTLGMHVIQAESESQIVGETKRILGEQNGLTL